MALATTAFATPGLDWLSMCVTTIFRPRMPPAALISCTARSTPFCQFVPDGAPGPDSSTVSISLTVGWAAAGAAAARRATRARTARRLMGASRVPRVADRRAQSSTVRACPAAGRAGGAETVWTGRGPPCHAVPTSMAGLLQLLVSGLAAGAIYALAAIGFTLLWQTSQTINFAQGEFVMLPAFLVLAGMRFLGLGFWPAMALGLVA